MPTAGGIKKLPAWIGRLPRLCEAGCGRESFFCSTTPSADGVHASIQEGIAL